LAGGCHRALESVSIASALSSALIMPDPSPSTLTVLNYNFLQIGRKSGGQPATADSLPLAVTCQVVNCETHCI